MKFYLFAIGILAFTACGSTRQIDHVEEQVSAEGYFILSMPDPQEDLSKRYPCKDGYTISEAFTSEEKALIQSGFDMFNEHSERPNLVHFVDKATNCSINKTDLPGLELGVTNVSSSSQGMSISISFDTNLYSIAEADTSDSKEMKKYYSTVVLHELMHSARSGHLADGLNGVMAALIGTVPDWSKNDQALCEAVFICPKKDAK